MIKPIFKICEYEINYQYNPKYITRSIPVVYYDEYFVDINLPFAYGFKISNYGRVYNTNIGYMVPSTTSGNGYKQVRINAHTCLLHRVMMQTFEPLQNPEEYQVNHKDCKKYNNRLRNLEWVTVSENMLHVYKNSLQPQGEDHLWTKFSDEQISLICDSLQKRLPYREICKLLGVEYSKNMSQVITSIRQKRNRKSVSNLYDLPDLNSNKQVFTNEEVREICRCFQMNMPTRLILQRLNYPLDGNGTYSDNENIFEVIGKIRRRTTFTSISKDYNF